MPRDLRVALATCRRHPGLAAGDDEALSDALAPLGIATERPVWSDPAVDWSAFDAVLVRTTWDYTSRVGEFLAWMRRAAGATAIFNPPEIAAANLNKTYLKQVEDSAVPTVWADREAETDGVLAALAEARDRGWERIAMKPAVGAGAELLKVGKLGDEGEWAAHAAAIHRNSDAMVQPFVESIRDRGELSIVLIDGVATHAVRKTPAAGDHRVQMEFGGRYKLEEPSDAAKLAAGAAAALWTETPLYARIDLVEPAPEEYLIIEVELVEPELFFPLAPRAGEALGVALRERLEALG
jgi:glutathione synthase/RimK-type ligase-like ATP-grasp enzyme